MFSRLMNQSLDVDFRWSGKGLNWFDRKISANP
jgi:hypothetical protein